MIAALSDLSLALQIGGALIDLEESDELNAYPDPATGGAPWTIGRGNTTYLNGAPVKEGDVITQDQSDALFRASLLRRCTAVDGLIKLISATPLQRAAFYSFAWNEGYENLAISTMLRLFNAGDIGAAIFANDGVTITGYSGAAGEFTKWDYANGKPMRGLLNRRVRERSVYFGDISGLGFPSTFAGA